MLLLGHARNKYKLSDQIPDQRMKNIYKRLRRSNAPTPGRTEWEQLRANAGPNFFRIFPIEHGDENMVRLKSRTISTSKELEKKRRKYNSYYQLSEKMSKIVATAIGKQPKEGRLSEKYLNASTCNKLPPSSGEPSFHSIDLAHTPYMQRKLNTARNKFETKMDRKFKTSSKEDNIQIAYAVKLHPMHGNQENENIDHSSRRNYRSSESKCRSKILHPIKCGHKVEGSCKVQSLKDNLRPWSGNLYGFVFPNQVEHYCLHSSRD